MKTSIFKTQFFHDKRIQRVIEIPCNFSLYELAEAIICAYDFDFDHPFGFFSKITDGWNGLAESRRYELFADLDPKEAHGAKSVKKTSIDAVWKNVDDKMLFLFDYGDEWRWIIVLNGYAEKKADIEYPRVLSSSGDAPEQYAEFDEEEGGTSHNS